MKIYSNIYFNELILYATYIINSKCFNEDSGDLVFSCSDMDILNIDLGNIYLNNNFDEDDPDAITFCQTFGSTC